MTSNAEVRHWRAARIAALVLLDDAGQLEGALVTDLAQAFGVSWRTVYRDKQAVAEVRRLRDNALAAVRRRLELERGE